MTTQDMLAVAKECQKLGRSLSRLQNVTGVSVSRPWIVRALRSLTKGFLFPTQYELTPKFVSDTVSALISAGNMLEVRAKEDLAHQPDSNGEPSSV